MNFQTVVKKETLQGTTPRITFQIVDEDGVGFLPDVLTMSVYDVDFSVDPATETIINDRNDLDILADCDASGNVEVYLSEDDTDVTVPDGSVPSQIKRKIRFRWEWDTTKVGKHEVILPIAPDRETVAT